MVLIVVDLVYFYYNIYIGENRINLIFDLKIMGEKYDKNLW